MQGVRGSNPLGSIEFQLGISKIFPEYWACTEEWFRPFLNKVCARDFLEKKVDILNRINSTNELLASLAKENSNVYDFDAFNILCPTKRIWSNYLNNTLIYRETNHLTSEGNKYLPHALWNSL